MADSTKTYVRVTSNEVKLQFYSHRGENALKTGDMATGRVDLVLEKYTGCPSMLTENTDVCNGQANGSKLKLQRVKHGEQPIVITFSSGTKVRVYVAPQYLLWDPILWPSLKETELVNVISSVTVLYKFN
jgi:hypothetical protein